MAYGIDNIIEQTANAYQSNPGRLQQKYVAEKQLIDLLALEKIRSQQKAIANDMMAKTQVPEATVKDQVESEVLNNERQMVAQRAMQGGQQLAMNQQRAAQARGIPSVAGNAVRMQAGGITGYAEGGQVEEQDPMQAQLERYMRLQDLYDRRQNAGASEEELARIQADIDSYSGVNVPGYNIQAEAAKARGQYDSTQGMARGGSIEGGMVQDDILSEAIIAEGVDDPALVALLRSIYEQETSGGRNVRTSAAGAQGPLQVMPGTFEEMSRGELNMRDPLDLTRAGVRYAMQAMRASGGDPRLAAAYYFGGPGGMSALARGEEGASDVLGKSVSDYASEVASRMGVEERTEDGYLRDNAPVFRGSRDPETPEGGIPALLPMPMRRRKIETQKPTEIKDNRAGINAILESIDPAAAPKEADIMRTVADKDAEKQRVVRYMQGLGRSQDAARERGAQGGLSYIKALADAEAAQKANAMRYLQQAGKFQEMQGGTEDMLAALDPAAMGVKGFAGPDGSFVEGEEDLYVPTMADVIAVEQAKRDLLEAGRPQETSREQGKIDVRGGESYTQALRRRDQERAARALEEMYPRREAEASEPYAPNLADVIKVGDAQARLRKISELNAQLENEGRQFKRDAIQAEINALNAPMQEEATPLAAPERKGPAKPTTPLEYLQDMGRNQEQVEGMMRDIYGSGTEKKEPMSEYERLKAKYEAEANREPSNIARIAEFLQGVGQSRGTNIAQSLIGGGSALSAGDAARRMERQKAVENLLALKSKEKMSEDDLAAAMARAGGTGGLTQNQRLSAFIKLDEALTNDGTKDQIRMQVEQEFGTGNPEQVSQETERRFKDLLQTRFNDLLNVSTGLGTVADVGATITPEMQAADRILGE